MTGSAGLVGKDPGFKGDITVKDISMPSVMTSFNKPPDMVSGVATADMTFSGSGKKWPAIRQTLTGAGSFSFANGGLKNTPITRALAALLGFEEFKDLAFDDFFGEFKVSNGQVMLSTELGNSELEAKLNGKVGLDGSLDMPMTIRLSQDQSQRLQGKFYSLPILSQIRVGYRQYAIHLPQFI